MSNADRTVKVHARKKMGSVKFHLEDEDGTVGDTLVFDKKDPMKKGDFHKVTFELVREEGVSLRFPSDKNRAIWVRDDGATVKAGCPTANDAQGDFVAQHVDANRLIVHNKNPKKAFYKFALNFVKPTDTDESDLITYDPVFENRNGGTRGISTMMALALVGAGTIAVLATLSLCARTDQPEAQSN